MTWSQFDNMHIILDLALLSMHNCIRHYTHHGWSSSLPAPAMISIHHYVSHDRCIYYYAHHNRSPSLRLLWSVSFTTFTLIGIHRYVYHDLSRRLLNRTNCLNFSELDRTYSAFFMHHHTLSLWIKMLVTFKLPIKFLREVPWHFTSFLLSSGYSSITSQ